MRLPFFNDNWQNLFCLTRKSLNLVQADVKNSQTNVYKSKGTRSRHHSLSAGYRTTEKNGKMFLKIVRYFDLFEDFSFN